MDKGRCLSDSTTSESPYSQTNPRVRLGPSGILFFDRLTGLNVLVDEVCVPPRLWSRAPRNVSIALTNACDLRCPFCYAPKVPATLDVNTLYGWIDELDTHGCLGIGFGGGEPTLSTHLPSLCRYIAHSTRMATTLTTHGHLFDDSLAATLRGHVHFIRVSMDGIGPTYEDLRGRSFNAFLSRVSTIRRVAPFGINFVVNDTTFPDLDDAVLLAHTLGAQEFVLLPERPVRGMHGLNAHTMEGLRKWVASFNGPIRLLVSAMDAECFPVCDPLSQEPGLSAYAHIDALGTLKETSYDQCGVPITAHGVMEALTVLKARQESHDEDLERVRI